MRLLSTLLLLLSTTPVLAQNTETELLRCAAQSDGVMRLACFDALTAKLRAVPSAPAVAADAAPVLVVTPEQKLAAFGVPLIAPKDELAAIESRIEGLFEGWDSGGIFTLANGQRWMVTDGSRAVLYLKSPKVTVRRAPLGGFRIEFEGSNQTARVKRL